MNKDLARLEIRYTNTLSSVVLDDYRINSVKWNDIPDGKYMLHIVNKKDILQALGVNKQITDLEAKLAEKDKALDALNKIREMVSEDSKLNYRRYLDTLAKNEQLEQQLADKEKEIEFIKHERETNGASYVSACKVLTKERQDKISFAVEQIIKLKEKLIKFLQDEGFYDNEWYDFYEIIDNQIKQLKEKLDE